MSIEMGEEDNDYLIEASSMELNTTTIEPPPPLPGSHPPVRDEDLAKIEMGVLLLIFIFTVIGNLIVILGILFRHQKMSRMYYFILHLSIADLVTAFFNVATQFFMELTWPEFHGPNLLCKFVKYGQILGPYSSSYVLVMTAFDRYNAICNPLRSLKGGFGSEPKIMLSIAWIIAVAFCTPQLFIFSLEEIHPGLYDCYASFTAWGAKAYVTWYSLSFFIVPLLLLIFAYSCICRTLWLNASGKSAGRRDEEGGGSVTYTTTSTSTNSAHPHQLRSGESRLSTDSISSDEIIKPNVSSSNKVKRLRSSNQLMNMIRVLKPSAIGQKKKKTINNNGYLGRKELLSAMESNGRVHSQLASTSSTSTCSSIRDPRRLIRRRKSDEEGSRVNVLRNKLQTQLQLDSTSTSTSTTFPTTAADTHEVVFDDEHGTEGGDEESHADQELEQMIAKSNDSPTTIVKNNNSSSSRRRTSSSEPKRLLSFDGHKSRPQIHSSTSSCGPSSRSRQDLLYGGGSRSMNSPSIYWRASNDTVAIKDSTVSCQPRAHSTSGISRAKIKTIKLTITIIFCYIICSSPFIAAQLWATYDPHAVESPFYTGTTFTILILLASLNSCVNPYIFLFFNPNLLEDFLAGLCCRKSHNLQRQKSNKTSAVTLRTQVDSRKLQASPLLELQASSSPKIYHSNGNGHHRVNC